jgi:hypothetical protein
VVSAATASHRRAIVSINALDLSLVISFALVRASSAFRSQYVTVVAAVPICLPHTTQPQTQSCTPMRDICALQVKQISKHVSSVLVVWCLLFPPPLTPVDCGPATPARSSSRPFLQRPTYPSAASARRSPSTSCWGCSSRLQTKAQARQGSRSTIEIF